MKTKRTIRKVLYLIIVLSILLGGCDIVVPQKATETPTATATPTETMTPTVVPSPTFTPPLPPTEAPPTETVTPMPVVVMDTPTNTAVAVSTGRCANLNGRFEVRVLTPEAAVLGITSVTIGEIPFYVTTEFEPYRIQGKSKLIYQEEYEDEDLGTLKVNTNLMGTVNGKCVAGNEGVELQVNITITGNQTVVVRAKGSNVKTPWSGGETMAMTFGLSNGYTLSGEKWMFVLWKGINEVEDVDTDDDDEDDD